ncbi:MAG: hypothetical protein ACTHMM_26455 [Agriterribacter sp.]
MYALLKYVVRALVSSLLIFSCSTSKKAISVDDTQKCLILDPTSANKTNFNPKWLSQNNIRKIVEREYLNGKEGKIHLVNVLHFDTDGYLQTRYSGLSYPENDSPNEKEIFSRRDYTYTKQDSFLIQTELIVRFHDGKGKLEMPDTLPYPIVRALNVHQATQLKNEQNEVVEYYEYDSMKRLTSVKNKDGTLVFSVRYQQDNKIQIGRFSSRSGDVVNSWATLNTQGLIIKNYEESSGISSEFSYNDKGEMIEEKMPVADKALYRTYEYLK